MLFIVLIFFISCKKNLVEVNADYTGNWVCPSDSIIYSLTIDESGKGKYTEISGGTEKNKHEGILRIKDDKMTMKGIYLFRIIESPEKLDSMVTFVLHDYEYPVTWKMKLKIPDSFGSEELQFYK